MRDRVALHIARILGKGRDGSPTTVGTGFVAPHGYLATCAHVATKALTGSDKTSAAPPRGVLSFELQDEENKLHQYEAECVAEYWGPAREKCSPGTRGDYALLRILDHERPPPEGLFSAEDPAARKIWGFGFPTEGNHAAPREGCGASGEIEPMKRRDGVTAFHALHAEHPFIVAGFSGAPLFACDHSGLRTGPVIGMNQAVGVNAPGTAFLLSAGIFARMHQEIAAKAYKRTFEPSPIDLPSLRRNEGKALLAEAANKAGPSVESATEKFAETARRKRNMLPEPYSAGLLEDLTDDISAAFARTVRPDATSIGGFAADLLYFLRLEVPEFDEGSEVLRKVQTDAMALVGALAPSETHALSAGTGGYGVWPPGLQTNLAVRAAELLQRVDEVSGQGWSSADLAVIEDEARAIRRAARSMSPDWARMNGSAVRIKERAKALGFEPFREAGGSLLAALREASHQTIADLPPLAAFRELPFTPEMIQIPTGSFLMGSPKDEVGRHPDEGPQHRVDIRTPFALARHPVTVDEFDRFCDETGRKKFRDAGSKQGSRPVINVTLTDAQSYCDWLSAQTGAVYRLPSEAEWEYACRAETETARYWGDAFDPVQANTESAIGHPTSVAAYPSNPWGLYDMLGNVWEWCADIWADDYRSGRIQAAFQSSPGETDRVLRGGSWNGNAGNCRSAYRNRNAPGIRYNRIGFRPARGQAPGL
ncbi:SUMF1/EgtB/PvdO family nonheme iron enzyme [Salipiger sp. H15]|uniref:SUMF1/EgtB/PvdO family nonheme iron enzyme n=1 Tax=Alloyangia sp. H15 TaxID=3029062 RepID=A0AAU8APV5_9RHOB